MKTIQELHKNNEFRNSFPGIQKEVECLFIKHADSNRTHRLKLLWGFAKADQIDFKQFERLVKLIMTDGVLT